VVTIWWNAAAATGPVRPLREQEALDRGMLAGACLGLSARRPL